MTITKITVGRILYTAANIEKLRLESIRKREKYAANPELRKSAKASKDKWVAKNPDYRRICNHNYNSKKSANGGKLSKGIKEKLFKLQRGKCACCGKPLGKNYHMDHKMPLALGGANEDWNIQLLRQQCNDQKSTKHPIDFMQSRGFLL